MSYLPVGSGMTLLMTVRVLGVTAAAASSTSNLSGTPYGGNTQATCPSGYTSIPNNLDGTGKQWSRKVGPDIAVCATLCSARSGCTGFEYSASTAGGQCGTYTGGYSNILADANGVNYVTDTGALASTK